MKTLIRLLHSGVQQAVTPRGKVLSFEAHVSSISEGAYSSGHTSQIKHNNFGQLQHQAMETATASRNHQCCQTPPCQARACPGPSPSWNPLLESHMSRRTGCTRAIFPKHNQEHCGAAAEDRVRLTVVLQLLTAERTDPSNSILRSHLPKATRPDLVWLFMKLQSFCTPLRCTPTPVALLARSMPLPETAAPTVQVLCNHSSHSSTTGCLPRRRMPYTARKIPLEVRLRGASML